MEAIVTTVAADRDIRKHFGQRIILFRKQRNWIQKKLASKIDVRFPQVNKYECGRHTPLMEKLVKMAKVFDATIDFLHTGDRCGERPMHNLRLLERFQGVEDRNAEDQEAVIKLIDAMSKLPSD
jgi:transcriptional regulator with XRE-family HTH domain